MQNTDVKEIRNFSVIIPIRDGKVFMLRRSAKHHIGMWEFPAGKSEGDEEPLHTAIREYLEETGDVANLLPDNLMMRTSSNGVNGLNIRWYNYYWLNWVAGDRDLKVAEPHVHSDSWWIPLDMLEYMTTKIVPIHAVVIPQLLLIQTYGL